MAPPRTRRPTPPVKSKNGTDPEITHENGVNRLRELSTLAVFSRLPFTHENALNRLMELSTPDTLSLAFDGFPNSRGFAAHQDS